MSKIEPAKVKIKKNRKKKIKLQNGHYIKM